MLIFELMESITLQTESYLFENSTQTVRAIPFYELSIEEFVVFEKKQPKYFIDFNRRSKPLIQDLLAKVNSGESLETVIWKLGNFIGRDWSLENGIEGTEVSNSWQVETIELVYLDNFRDFFIDITFIATDELDAETFLDEDKLLASRFVNRNGEYLGIEPAFIDNETNLQTMLALLFKADFTAEGLVATDRRKMTEITIYKNSCISVEELDAKYEDWIKLTERQNSMDEYGNLLGIISYVKRNSDKKHLLMVTEKRSHFS